MKINIICLAYLLLLIWFTASNTYTSRASSSCLITMICREISNYIYFLLSRSSHDTRLNFRNIVSLILYFLCLLTYSCSLKRGVKYKIKKVLEINCMWYRKRAVNKNTKCVQFIYFGVTNVINNTTESSNKMKISLGN